MAEWFVFQPLSLAARTDLCYRELEANLLCAGKHGEYTTSPRSVCVCVSVQSATQSCSHTQPTHLLPCNLSQVKSPVDNVLWQTEDAETFDTKFIMCYYDSAALRMT